MENGYIKLHRKISKNEIWGAEKFTRGQAMVDLIMLANYDSGFVWKRGIRVPVDRGEIGWSEVELSKRWMWSRGKVRRFLKHLCSGSDPFLEQQSVQQNNNVTAKYKIVKYERYQGSGTADGTPSSTADGTGSKKNKEKTPEEKIENLRARYQDQDLIDAVFAAIASTRKSNQVANSVLAAQMEKWDGYSVSQVESGMKIYITGKYYEQGKREEYLYGIIRRQSSTTSDSKTPGWL